MIRVIRTIILIHITCLQIQANTTIDNSENLERVLKESNLVFMGNLSDIKVLGVFNKSLYKSNPTQPVNAAVIYTGLIKIGTVLQKKALMDSKEQISVVWFDYATTDLQYSVKRLASSLCPPISISAYQKEERIWFIKYDHGIWRLICDQPKSLVPHIREFLKTGKAKQLDLEYQKHLESLPKEDGPFGE